MDKETIQTLLDLLNPLHGSLDLQTYDEKCKHDFDGPLDAEHNVTITAQQERDLTQAVCILENRLRTMSATAETARRRLEACGEQRGDGESAGSQPKGE